MSGSQTGGDLFAGALPLVSSPVGQFLLTTDLAGALFRLEPAGLGTGTGGEPGGGGDGPALSDAPAVSLGATGLPGTAVTASRSDHRHPLPSAAAIGAAPLAHTHAISEITNLTQLLDQKANTNHTHGIAGITGLDIALGQKAPLAHTHSMSDVTNLMNTLENLQPLNARGAANGYAPLDENGLVPLINLPSGIGSGGGGGGGGSNMDNGTADGQVAVWDQAAARGRWRDPVPVTSDRTQTVGRNAATTLSFLDYNRRLIVLTGLAPLALAASEIGTAPNQGMEFAIYNRHNAINTLTFGAGIEVDPFPAGTGSANSVKIAVKGFVVVSIMPVDTLLVAVVRGQIA